ncbi:alpha/beta hydrolase [Phaeocystidibacter marisrubri]|uniref:Alpha/beta hydrolase n=1 Tax=Phaeocystidibacter marisrubri TaxID=1577780 RepID=A0A6L3ZI45_9FLAO|nr:alpha/beta hydrolase [Phaeocystidibacter marisrubri]KAB2817544.1 alpha/beta hydrolase [Phaeocystidibacter marisrubri]GGH74810.1 hypothetical protein GCM10011318_21190 [Phaeocystidibacter marisrubri]
MMRIESRNIHAFSGLGADETAFDKLQLAPHSIIYHPWPAKMPHVRMEEFALEVAKTIREDSPILMGLSFGGIFAIEVAKHLVDAEIILISSVVKSSHLPRYMRIAGRLKLYALIPPILYITPTPLLIKAFGASTPALKRWLITIVTSSSVSFNRWAVKELLEWRNSDQPSQYFHIHGTVDHVLPIRKGMSVDLELNGGHLIILTHAKVISEVILQRIS